MADTPTPTAQDAPGTATEADWEALGMESSAGGAKLIAGRTRLLALRLADAWSLELRWDTTPDGWRPHDFRQVRRTVRTEAEAWTICAALVLLAAGVLSAGAQQ